MPRARSQRPPQPSSSCLPCRPPSQEAWSFDDPANSPLTGDVARQLEVDVLEGGAAHLERLELLAARERLGGQLVQAAGRIGRALDELLAVPAVADLGL